MEWLLFAETAEQIGVNSGWTGAGLLGLVVATIFFKILPDKDKQQEKLMATHAATIKELTDKHEAAVARVVEHCEKDTQAVTHEIRQLTIAMQDLGEMVSGMVAHDARPDAPGRSTRRTMKADQ